MKRSTKSFLFNYGVPALVFLAMTGFFTWVYHSVGKSNEARDSDRKYCSFRCQPYLGQVVEHGPPTVCACDGTKVIIR